jgi:hypothetical protein
VDKNHRDPDFLVTSRKNILKGMAGQAGSERSVDDLIRDLSEKYGHLSEESPMKMQGAKAEDSTGTEGETDNCIFILIALFLLPFYPLCHRPPHRSYRCHFYFFVTDSSWWQYSTSWRAFCLAWPDRPTRQWPVN